MNLKQFYPHFWIVPFISFFAGYYLIRCIQHTTLIKTPSLIGKSLAESVRILSEKNLNPRILTEKEDNDLPPDIVLSQKPTPDSSIRSNQSVFLVISKKPQSSGTPTLSGRLLTDIEEKIKNDGIALETHHVASQYPKNYCVGQFPQPDSALESKKVIAYVSQGNKKPIIFPNFKNKPVNEVTQFLNTNAMIGQLFHTHPQPADHTCERCVILDQRPFAGSLITLSDEKPLIVQLQVQAH